MGSLGYKSRIYDGDTYVGDVEVFPMKTRNRQFPNNEIRINYFTPSSERCPPLSILLSIFPSVIRYKLQSKGLSEHCLLFRLHASCFRGLKTAVVLFEDEELHLVAMPTKQQRLTCFWCFSVPLGLYMSCLGMLNLRCLAIVFDLDETLIVANTMKSFEDKIEALRQKRANETDPFRISGMSAVLQRYVEDRALLKQYTECDYVMDNGKLFKVQLENVPLLPNNVEYMIRPVIRLQEKNVILTRINPEIRDTSVLVRLRPAWEDLKSYLTANGRKRFEVFVCTMAERDYALEMWRLLDPKAHLINTRQLLERVVCVKSGLRKSLLNVFQNGICHPKMAMVIDDRQNVWEDNDQCQVHVVPAFTPYAAPQAETANAVPVLCVARNVASNVRSGFFKEFNDNLLRRTFELSFEDDTSNLPSPPDVSSHLMSEGTGFAPNGRRDALSCEGINYAEVERRINQPVSLESDRQIRSLLQSTQSFSSEDDENHASTSGRDVLSESGKVISLLSSVSTAVLQEIGRRCSSKVEFNYVVSISEDLPWSVEVLFAGEKVGTGVGKTKKEAQLKASEDALHNLADQYREDAAADSEAVVEDCKLSLGNENGFLWEFVDFRLEELQKPCVSNSKAAEDDVHGSSG